MGRLISWIEERERLIEFVASLYVGVSDSVAAYLRANSDLAWALIGAKAALLRAFGVTLAARLELVADIDADENRTQLFVYIQAGLDAAKASSALDRFDQEWFLARANTLGGYVAFDLDF